MTAILAIVVVFVIRTTLENKTLQKELDGYSDAYFFNQGFSYAN
jgi:hypothetical protein